VIDRAQPFIVPIANWSREAVHPVDQPLNTVTAWPRGGAFALATPVMINAAHGEGRPGGVTRWGRGSKPVDEPLGTVTASGGGGHSVATAVLAGVGGRAGQTEPRAVDSPAYTITAKADAALVTAFLAQANGGFNTTHSKAMDEPMTTVTNSGSQQQLVTVRLSKGDQARALRCAAFMINYYGNGDARSLEQPLDTITTRDRLALVTVWIGGDPYVIVDICLRMLQPHELYAAQGFPSNYIIDRGHDGRRFTKSEQVHMCGNSVSPPPMAAIAAANNPWRIDELEQREAA